MEKESKAQKEYANGVTLIGNIAPSTITIDKEKGLAKYSIAVSQGKDKDPLWFNCSSFKKEDGKLFQTLETIKQEGKGKQVTAKGFIKVNEAEKEGETKYYTNFNINSVVPTKDFIKPAVNFALSGQVWKALEEHTKNSINQDGKEVERKYGVVTLAANNNKNGKEYYSFVTSNKEHIEELKKLSKGESLSIKGSYISPSGKISLNKYTKINNKEFPSNEQYKEPAVSR